MSEEDCLKSSDRLFHEAVVRKERLEAEQNEQQAREGAKNVPQMTNSKMAEFHYRLHQQEEAHQQRLAELCKEKEEHEVKPKTVTLTPDEIKAMGERHIANEQARKERLDAERKSFEDAEVQLQKPAKQHTAAQIKLHADTMMKQEEGRRERYHAHEFPSMNSRGCVPVWGMLQEDRIPCVIQSVVWCRCHIPGVVQAAAGPQGEGGQGGKYVCRQKNDAY